MSKLISTWDQLDALECPTCWGMGISTSVPRLGLRAECAACNGTGKQPIPWTELIK